MDFTKAGGSAMTTSNFSPSAFSRSSSLKASARRASKRSATPLASAARVALSSAPCERSTDTTDDAPSTAQSTPKPPL